MIAVVKIAGKQYLVEEGKSIKILSLLDNGDQKNKIDQVLMIASDKKISLGSPTVKDAYVEFEKIAEGKDKKVLVVKHHPKKRYRRVKGHRQNYSRLLIGKINEK